MVIHSKRPCEVLQDGHGLEDGPAVVLDGWKGEERIDLEKFWGKKSGGRFVNIKKNLFEL